MRFLDGQGFVQDGRPASAQNAFGRYFDITGRVADYIWLGDALTSQLPKSPPIALTANGGALSGQAFPVDAEGEPNESPLVNSAYQYTNALGVFHEVADPQILDFDGSESWALSVLFRTTSDNFPANTGGIVGKREATGSLNGWELLLQGATGAATVQWRGADAVTGTMTFSGYNSTAGQHRYADGRLHTLDLEFDVTAGEIRAGNEHQASMVTAWSPTSFSTATTFRLGAIRGFAAPIQIAYLFVSVGERAMRGDPSDTAYLLAQETSLTFVQRHNGEPVT